ncbi:MAG: aminodeoxychorismate synthase component I [Bacillota bacterium]
MTEQLPLIKKVKLAGSVEELFARFRNRPHSFFLDTGMRVPGLGRHSFMGADPFLVMQSRGGWVELSGGGREETLRAHPLAMLKQLLAQYQLPYQANGLPFNAGAVGYFSYDLGRQLEVLPEMAADDLGLADCCLGFYDLVLAFDQNSGDLYLISTGLPEKDGARALKRARRRLREVEELIAGPAPEYSLFVPPARQAPPQCHFDQASYCRVVRRAIDYIAAGDIFQVNLSQRFSVAQREDAWAICRRLRKINPAPLASFLSFDDVEVVSASPERFLRVNRGMVETCPIKGTRPRGHNREEDLRLRRELWNSEKDRAELVMIVDLERNDLGRVCRVGSVKVPELYRLEEYPTVFHLVSTVVGELGEGKDVVDLLGACFPGGSITGAPKVRAMEIIEELEPVRRGIYTGSIGYLGFDGEADLNIVIRTLVVKNGRIYFQVGGGITADSDPLAEYLETLDKARALVRALELEEGAVRWNVSSV